jgi:hypothetical protein
MEAPDAALADWMNNVPKWGPSMEAEKRWELYRQKAAEAERAAALTSNFDVQVTLLKIAAAYWLLATMQEREISL